MIEVSNLVDLFESGLPPVAGGSLNQTAWFLDAAREIKTCLLYTSDAADE